MGLDTTHGAWNGTYSAFGHWRNAMALAAGYPLTRDGMGIPVPALDWAQITAANIQGEWDTTPEDALVVLIAHSDCDGVIHPTQARALADRLETLLPLVPAWADETQQFIAGLRCAVRHNEPLEFC